MMYLPVVLFAIAAVGGMALVTMKFSGKDLPWVLIIGHGLFAAAGLVALIANVTQNPTVALANTALVLFLIAAVGGFVLFSFQVRKKALPNALILIHGGVAVVSFLLLLFAVAV
ncbi:MAG: hypothetical protein EG826_11740 [Deltaproteobacteria bacterium]|nr:hypothetical protein [Deltaproteobacteria bacterium]